METIFVVDDCDVDLVMVKQALEASYKVFALTSADAMFELVDTVVPDLVLLDIRMPDMDGFTALGKLAADSRTAAVPVIFMTSYGDAETEAHAFEAGIVDFINKPFSQTVLLRRVGAHLRIDDLIKRRTAKLWRLKNGIVSVLADIVEFRDDAAGGHIDRTSQCIKVLIEALKENGVYADELANWDIDTTVASARLHDIGKIAISDTILNKPGKLTPEEFAIVKSHVKEGERIIDKIVAKTGDEEFLQIARQFVSYHHERWDGAGYPYGLAGLNIPLAGRIMSIIDVYDALVSARPYKKPFTPDLALSTIMQESGKHFDPNIAEVFFLKREAFNEIAINPEKHE
ncbi:MAG: response regulator [Chitinispirillales bacterium]|nr:response regulator [Chitinispirillales bacterium]